LLPPTPYDDNRLNIASVAAGSAFKSVRFITATLLRYSYATVQDKKNIYYSTIAWRSQ
jgi:hypothetical protein